MELAHNERGVVSVLLVALVVLLVVVAGVAVYNVYQTHVSTQVAKTSSPTPAVATATPTPSATPTPIPGSDTALILVAASSECDDSAKTNYGATLDSAPTIVGDAALVGVHCTGYQGGHDDILKKINGVWTIVYSGQQPPSKAIGVQYSLPSSWVQAN